MQPNTIPPHNTTLYTNTITHNHHITVLIHLLLSISVHIVTVPTSLLSFKIPVPHTPSPQYHVHVIINIINTYAILPHVCVYLIQYYTACTSFMHVHGILVLLMVMEEWEFAISSQFL